MNRGRGDGEPDIRVMEHIWGDTPDSLLVCTGPERPGFDLILLAEPLWKDTYPQHRQLLHSVRACLKKQSKPQLSSSHPQCRQRCGPCALVAFAHRPTSVTSTANGARKEEHPESAHTAAHDLEFFSMAREEFGLSVELLLSTWCKDVSGVRIRAPIPNVSPTRFPCINLFDPNSIFCTHRCGQSMITR